MVKDKNIVIVDIDGTIADISHRKHYLESSPKNWDAFYNACAEDKPIQAIIDLVFALEKRHYVIVFCSGRREECRQATNEWIETHFGDDFPYHLLLRPNQDFRHDTIVKPELLQKHCIDLDRIAFVLEDRNSVVAKWRELGLQCLQVAEGDF